MGFIAAAPAYAAKVLRIIVASPNSDAALRKDLTWEFPFLSQQPFRIYENP
jgi:hypothetical protein